MYTYNDMVYCFNYMISEVLISRVPYFAHTYGTL